MSTQDEQVGLSGAPIEVVGRSWFPGVLREKLRTSGQVEMTIRFSAGIKKLLEKPRPMPPSKWAEQHRVVTLSSVPGRWKNEVTPYLAGVMDAITFPSVTEAALCKGPQMGGSEAVVNLLGYWIDRAPGPMLLVYPDQETAREISKDRILPMIEASPGLHTYLTGAEDDKAALRIKLKHMVIYLGWARSPSRLASKPIRYVFCDETDKYPDTAGKREADPIALAAKRLRTFAGHGAKLIKVSTPTVEVGPIWQALLNAEVVFDYWVRCPLCNQSEYMVFDNIKFPKEERDPERMESARLAWYECGRCGAAWSDEVRNQAVLAGGWYARDKEIGQRKEAMADYLNAYRPGKIAFHLPAWLSRFVSLSSTAAAFLRGQGNQIKLRDFMNAHKAEPWKTFGVERQEDAILALADDRPRGLVPGGGVVAGLTAAIDTQDVGFYYEIRAWAWESEESWQVREGFAEDFKQLEELIWGAAYRDSEGNRYNIECSAIDCAYPQFPTTERQI